MIDMDDIPMSTGPLNEIRPDLYLGSREAETMPLTRLQNYGISRIVQVGTDMGMTPTHQASLCYCCVRAADIESEDLLSKLKQAEVHSFIHKALCSGGKVLVHCLAGVSRSAATVMSYLMAKEGLDFEESLHVVMSKRNIIFPNSGFCDQLLILQEQCAGDLANYTAQMLIDLPESKKLLTQNWLALLMAMRERLRKEAAASRESSMDNVEDLQSFKDRLQRRKQLGREGACQGCYPPSAG